MAPRKDDSRTGCRSWSGSSKSGASSPTSTMGCSCRGGPLGVREDWPDASRGPLRPVRDRPRRARARGRRLLGRLPRPRLRPATDLTRPSRLRGWSGLDTCIHLGAWPDCTRCRPARERPRRRHGERRLPRRVQRPARRRSPRRGRRRGPRRAGAGAGRARRSSSPARCPPSSAATCRARPSDRCRSCRWCTPARTSWPCTRSTSPRAALPRRRRCCSTAGLAALMDVTGALAARSGVRRGSPRRRRSAPGSQHRPDGWTTARPLFAAFTGPGVRGSVSTCSTPRQAARTWLSCC